MSLEEQPLSTNLEKYNNIMLRYRNGEFGDQYLTLKEILEAANEKELFNEMSINELDYLILNSFGILKIFFASQKAKKIEALNNQTNAKKLERK